jgi:hypothetical protein
MTLQAVHTETRPVRASSLYCRWIREREESGELRAIWIDGEMRAFEGQLAGETNESALVDEPGGSPSSSKRAFAKTAVIELYKSS